MLRFSQRPMFSRCPQTRVKSNVSHVQGAVKRPAGDTAASTWP